MAAVAIGVMIAAVGLALSRLGGDQAAEIGPRADEDAPSEIVVATTSLPDDGSGPVDPEAMLTTDDQIPALTFRVGDQEWQTGGIASQWCGPDECYDASVDVDVTSPIIEWDTTAPLVIETPFAVETIRAWTNPAGQLQDATELRLEPIAGFDDQWTVISRPPVAAMAIGVQVEVRQTEPIAVNAYVHYGAELRPITEAEVDRPGLLDEAVAQSALDVRACDAGAASALHLDDEPPGRAFLSRPWTDFAGCLVRVDVVTSYVGADHCGWEETEVLTVGTPVLTRMTGAGEGTQYVRDPMGAYGDPALVEGFEPFAVLPPEAVQTPFFAGTARLWIDHGAAYLVDGFAVERWPVGNPPICN